MDVRIQDDMKCRGATTNATSRLVEFYDDQSTLKPVVDQLKKFKMAAIRVQNITNCTELFNVLYIMLCLHVN